MEDEASYEDDYEYEYSDEDDNDVYDNESYSMDSADMSVEYDNPGNSQDDSQNANGSSLKRMKSNLKDENTGTSKSASDRNADNNPNAAPVRIVSTNASSKGSGGELKAFQNSLNRMYVETYRSAFFV